LWLNSPDLDAFFTFLPTSRHYLSDEDVHEWFQGFLPLLSDAPNIVIVSLLGRKPDGRSEFSFYSFYGGWDTPEERSCRLSFQAWLDRWHKGRSIKIVEHPTCDYGPIPQVTLDAVRSDILRLLSEGQTIVVMDSGGDTRTRRVVSNHVNLPP
jgi:hypothetical protein